VPRSANALALENHAIVCALFGWAFAQPGKSFSQRMGQTSERREEKENRAWEAPRHFD